MSRVSPVARLLRWDYVSLLIVVSIVTFGIATGVSLIVGRWNELANVFTLVFACITACASLVGIPVICLRMRRFRYLQHNGISVQAEYIGRWQYRDHVKIRYRYCVANVDYEGSAHIASLTLGEHWPKGKQLALNVDPDNPRVAMPIDAFTV